MTTITFRLSHEDRAVVLRAATRDGVSVSDYIRRALDLYAAADDPAEQLADHERRLSALEELASRSSM